MREYQIYGGYPKAFVLKMAIFTLMKTDKATFNPSIINGDTHQLLW
jgi:hypothetical protein